MLVSLLIANISYAYDDSVATAQRQLNQLGYEAGEVDGQMGPTTRGAIKAFQEDTDLRRTGRLDTATKGKLTEKAEIQRKRRMAKRKRRRSGDTAINYRNLFVGVGTGEADTNAFGSSDSELVFDISGAFTPFPRNRQIFMRPYLHIAFYEDDNRDSSNTEVSIARLGFDVGYGFAVLDKPQLTLHYGLGVESVAIDIDRFGDDFNSSDDFSGNDGEVGVNVFGGIRYRVFRPLELQAEAKLGLSGARDGLGLDLKAVYTFGRVFGLYMNYSTLTIETDIQNETGLGAGGSRNVEVDQDNVSAGVYLRF